MAGIRVAGARKRLGWRWRVATTAPGGEASRELIREGQGALDAVASGRRLSAALRSEVRSAHAMRSVFIVFSFASILAGLLVFKIEVGTVKRMHLFEHLVAHQSTVAALLLATLFYSMLFVAVLAARWTAHAAARLPNNNWDSYRTLYPLLRALAACESPQRVDELPRLLRAAERSVRHARLRRGTVPRRSHRQPVLKDHAGQVIAALRKAEAGLDTYPDLARCDLAAKLHNIAEAYVDRRLGALLPESDLKDLEPLREFESLWLAVLAVAYPTLTWTAGSVGLTGGVQTQTVWVGMLITAVVLFGRRALQKLQELPGLLKGSS